MQSCVIVFMQKKAVILASNWLLFSTLITVVSFVIWGIFQCFGIHCHLVCVAVWLLFDIFQCYVLHHYFGDHTGSVTFSSLELALSEQYSLQSAKLFSNSYIVIPILIQSKFSVRPLSEATSSSYNNLHETPFELWLTALFTNMWILKFVFHCHQSS